eukprot:4611791-Prymnesium_polylepis.1
MAALAQALPLLVSVLAASLELDADELHNVRATLHKDGIAVLRGFSDATETSAMIETMASMVGTWWEAERAADASKAEVFRTDSEQVKAQATSDYFFSSADRVHFFREPPANIGAEADGAACAEAETDGPPPLNKVGHGLHLNTTTPFGRYSQSPKVAAVLNA